MIPSHADILTALPRFSQRELRTIYARVGVLLNKIEEPAEDRQDEKSVYLVFAELLLARYGTKLPKYEIARTLPLYSRYKLTSGAKAVVDFIDREVKGLKGASREAAIAQCVACCVGSIRYAGGRETTACAAAALRDVASCVDLSFPGYAEYGMLGLIFGSERKR